VRHDPPRWPEEAILQTLELRVTPRVRFPKCSDSANNANRGLSPWYISVTMAAPSPHKPRRKVKKSSNGSEVSSVASSSVTKRPPPSTKPTYPLAAFLWPARSSVSQWEILPLILMAVGLFRWAAGLWGYSGKC
jgi:hypothetical protein